MLLTGPRKYFFGIAPASSGLLAGRLRRGRAKLRRALLEACADTMLLQRAKQRERW